MDIKIEGWKVTFHNENGDRLELKGEFEAGFFKRYDNKQLIIADVVGQSGQLFAFKKWELDKCKLPWDASPEQIIEQYINQ